MVALAQSQSAGSLTGVVTSLAVTLASPTAPGNCLAVCVAVISSITAGTVSAVTIGGAGDNFASLATLNGSSGQGAIWADPACGQASTSLVVSITGGSGAQGIAAAVFEFSGLAASSPLDQPSTHNNTSASTSWTSGTTAATAQAAEAWVGMGFAKASGLLTIGGPVSPWANVVSQTVRPGGSGNPGLFVAGYQIASSVGTATYGGTLNAPANGDGLVVTLLPGTAAVPQIIRPDIQAVRRASFW